MSTSAYVKPAVLVFVTHGQLVPFAIKEAVGRELNWLEAARFFCKVDHSDWAAPIVPVPKKDGAIRVCGDYKVSVNPMLQVDQYPIPNSNELMTSLANQKHFTKLNLKSAYELMLLDKESAKLVRINTHQGLYECNCLLLMENRKNSPTCAVVFSSGQKQLPPLHPFPVQ